MFLQKNKQKHIIYLNSIYELDTIQPITEKPQTHKRKKSIKLKIKKLLKRIKILLKKIK